MNKEELIKISSDFVNSSQNNLITEEIAISKEVVGMKIFETPIFGFAAAEDEYFTTLKEPSAIGEHFLLPNEWLHGRIEGQAFLNKFIKHLKSILIDCGYSSIAPSLHERFW